MSYIKTEKDKLVNLEYALNKELIRSNRAGAYASTTINGCNTRKYHGLLIAPVKNNEKILFLSSLDETIIQNGKEFRLGIHEYENEIFYPHGHRYIREFDTEPIPSKTYRVGGVILKKELLLSSKDHSILIRYTVSDAHSETVLRLQPLTAFRNIHELTKENFYVNTKKQNVKNGIKIKMYDTLPYLYMQISKKAKFVTAPDWNKNIVYREERKRGYEFKEDLFTYGYFELKVKKGDKIIFYAGLKEAKTQGLNIVFNSEIKKRTPRISFEHNLKNSAEQFFFFDKNEVRITAGFPWYEALLKESLLSVTGLTLPGNIKLFQKTFDTLLKDFFKEKNVSPEVPLLIFRTLQEYTAFADNCEEIWNKYGTKILKIFRNLKQGKYNAYLHDNGLLYIPDDSSPADGLSEVRRQGFLPEINALWYNALMYLSAAAEINNNKLLIKETENLPEKVKHFYNEIFINEEDEYLFDFVNNEKQNKDIRPYPVFAVSLPYSPLSDSYKKKILKKIKKHLLTSKGLRTLSPKHPAYKGKYCGNENERNKAKNQGSVHPYFIAEYCAGVFNLYKEQGLEEIKKIYAGFECEMNRHGIGSISELFDGNPPYEPGGAPSFAPSVAALLKIKMIIDTFDQNDRI